MIITFSGASGSGKSTLIKHIQVLEYFNNKEVKVKQEDDFLTFKVARKILGHKLFLEYKEQKFFNKPNLTLAARLFSHIVYLFYPLVVYAESIFDHIYYERIFKEKVLLSDRYIYDYIVTFKDILGVYNPVARFLYERFPRPYLGILIRISKATALERNKNKIKGKVTASATFHEKILQSYSKIAERTGALVVDGDKNLEVSVQKIEKVLVAKEKLLKIKTISISGTDGVGKTTLANTLCQYARDIGIECRVVHFYHDTLLYKLLRKLGFFPNPSENRRHFKIDRKYVHQGKTQGKPFIWALLSFLDGYVQYLFAGAMGRNGLIVYDRFFYDYLVIFEHLNIKHLMLFKKMTPRAGFELLLRGTVAVSLQRKPENTPEFFKKVNGLYSCLAEEYDIEVINVNNKTSAEVLEELLDKLKANHRL